MDNSLNPVITKLATGELLRIDDASGQSIAVVQGMVWITQEGDRRDVFLSDGENFAFDRPGTALVQAINNTRLLAFVGESAELIEHTAPASTLSDAPFEGHRGLAARAQLHRELASSACSPKSRRIGLHSGTYNQPSRTQRMKTIVNVVREWLQRSNQRFELAALSERQLLDIGLDRDFVRSEVTKPFWRA